MSKVGRWISRVGCAHRPPTARAGVGWPRLRPEAGQSGMAQLASRITGWTCNLIASGIVLAATLTFGRQVAQ